MPLNQIIGYAIISLGILFMFFGLFAMIRFKNFFPRLLCASKVDTVAMITIFVGLIIYNGFNFIAFRLALLLFIILLINPLIAHLMAQLAYLSGHRLGQYGKDLSQEDIEKLDDSALEFVEKVITEEQPAKDLYDIHE